MRRSTPATRYAMIAVATAASIATPEMALFENSMSACDESWGTSAFA